MKLSSVFLIIVLLISSCGERISGESQEAFESSLVKVEESLSKTEQEKLDKALLVVSMYAMSEKWNNADKYENKSMSDIALHVLDNKTYKNVVSFAEDFIEKENDKKIIQLEEEILELELASKKEDSTLIKLEAFKATDIEMVESSWEYPKIITTIINTGDLTKITEYSFKIDVYSIAQDKKIKSVVNRISSEEGKENGDNNFFTTLSCSLSDIFENSKRLQKQLENAQYPITDLAKYDLEVKVTPSLIETKNGVRYEYPEEVLNHQEQIKLLQGEIKELKNSNISLDSYVTDEPDTNTEPAFNEEYLQRLSKIRKKKLEQTQNIVKVYDNLALTFPVGYEIKKEKKGGIYIHSLSDELSFDIEDENLIQYQIRDTTYVEYESSFDKPNGVLDILKVENVNYDIKETIEELKRTGYYKLIDADDTGYMYAVSSFGNDYRISRYFKFGDTHYSYTMDFKDLEKCVLEFDRSKGIVK